LHSSNNSGAKHRVVKGRFVKGRAEKISTTRVALFIESSRAYGRGLLGGIAAYVRTHRPWSIFVDERALSEGPPAWLSDWDGHGIIARVESKRLITEIERLALPTVDLRGLHPLAGVPLIETNDAAVIRMACDHFLQIGISHIAYCGFSGADYSERRKALLIEHLEPQGISPRVLESPPVRSSTTSTIEIEGSRHGEDLGNWLMTLPRPVGVIACNDMRGQHVLNACRERGIGVPDEVAVVGVDNDELICDLTYPPLTSVECDTHRIGYEAAEMLASMMDGRAPPNDPLLINPSGIVPRRSTDVSAVKDKIVAAAVEFIHDHACDGLTVSDLAKHFGLSRSSLDRRFDKAIERSPKRVILQANIRQIKGLLSETDLKLQTIADKTGHAHHEYMCRIFKEHTGMTPGEYRTVHRSAASTRANRR